METPGFLEQPWFSQVSSEMVPDCFGEVAGRLIQTLASTTNPGHHHVEGVDVSNNSVLLSWRIWH